MGIYSPFQKLAVGSKSAEKSAAGRPANVSNLWPLQPASQPPGRPIPGFDLSVDRPVDRSQALTYQSTARSTGAISREQSSLDGRPLGRLAHQ